MRWVGCGLLGQTVVGKHDDDDDGYGGARDGDDHAVCDEMSFSILEPRTRINFF